MKNKLWKIHWLIFVITILASSTVDFDYSIFWLPSIISIPITIMLFSSGIILSLVLLLREKLLKNKLLAFMSIILYLIMLIPAFWPF